MIQKINRILLKAASLIMVALMTCGSVVALPDVINNFTSSKVNNIPSGIKSAEAKTKEYNGVSINEYTTGSNDLTDIYGNSGNDLVNYLEKNGDKYLGTPYNLAKYNQAPVLGPHGHMQCTGFVWRVLWDMPVKNHHKKNLIPDGTTNSGGCKWGYFNSHFHAEHQVFETDAKGKNLDKDWKKQKQYLDALKEALFKDGKLHKGDIIWLWHAGAGYGRDGFHHVGFYWGDSEHKDRFWHSSDRDDKFAFDNTLDKKEFPGNGKVKQNRVSKIEGKKAVWAIHVYHWRNDIPTQQSFEVKKVDSKTGKALSGCTFKAVNSQKDCTIKAVSGDDGIATFHVKEDDVGKFEVTETHAPKGYKKSDKKISITIKKGEHLKAKDDDFKFEDDSTTITGKLKLTKTLIGFSTEEQNGKDRSCTFELRDKSNPGAHRDQDDISKDGKNYKKTIEVKSNGTSDWLKDIPVGTYELYETKPPKGFNKANPKEIVIDKDDDPDDDGYIPATFKETFAYHPTDIDGELEVIDQDDRHPLEVEKKDTDGNPLPGAVFTVYSAADQTLADGTKLKKDQKVCDSLPTDDGGTAVTKGLWAGSYYAKETTAPEGYCLDPSVKPFTITDKKVSLSFVDPQVEILKLDCSGDSDNNAISGAVLGIYDSTGTTELMRWTTNDGTNPYTPTGLVVGQTYVLKEIQAPTGYASAPDQSFTVPADKNLTVTDYDEKVKVKKVDTKGNLNAGAVLRVIDRDTGEEKDRWTTGDANDQATDEAGGHYVSNIKAGEKCRLEEVTAAKGYVKAKPVDFDVPNNNTDSEVTMVDKRYYIKKTNHDASQAFNELNLHAQMTVVKKGGDPKNSADIVDQWWTDDASVLESDGQYKNYHAVNNLEEDQTYTLYETQVPAGWVKAAPEDFYVSGDKHDEEHVMRDKQYFIRKQDIFGVNLDGAHLEVRDDSGNVVDRWVTGPDTVITDKNSKYYYFHAVSGLEEGHHYMLYETQAPKDYVIATPEGFTVTGADGNGIKYDQEQTMKDKQLHVRKQDLGGNEVEGAKMQVIDKDDGNKVVDSWTSGSKEYIVQNLREGHHYILHEEASPDGYVVATDVEFYINNNKINENYRMVDKRIRAIKTDVNRKNPIEGAKMSVIDKDSGKTVDTWTSGKKFHYINGLVEGKTYILREEKAPKGYVRANDVLFTVSRAKETQTVYMTDKRVLISKKGVKIDSEVQGAKMAIYESEDGKITNDVAVDTWTTTDKPHYADGLSEGHEYTLVELRAPKGFVKAKPITFIATAASEDGIKADQLEVMVDKIFDVTKTDVSGKKEVPGAKLTVTDSETGKVIDTWISTTKAHHVSGLEEGRTYTLTEKRAPKGYVTAESVQFYVTEEKVNQHYKMKDKQVTVTKTDITGKKEVPGAELVVTDKKTGKKVDSWTSTTKKHYVNGLIENHDYVLTEVRAPKDYVKAESVTFRVTGEKVNQKHYMKDKQVTITKTDITGTKEIPGATLVVREKGKIIDKWVSTSKPHPVSGLKEGHTYVLTEKRAPSGYVKAESVKFYVSKDKIDQKHYMKDKQVLVSKQDITNKKELPGAHLTVTDKKTGKTVDSWTSTNEQHPVNGLEENRKYILTEVTAPNGYLKAESIEFFVSKEKVIQHVKMFDRPVAPKTGDDTDSTFYIAGAAVSLIVIAGAVVMKLKKGKKKE